MTDGKARAPGPVYRDEAAELMAAAARSTAPKPSVELELVPRRVVPEAPSLVVPRPYPGPVGNNDNAGEEPRRASRGRIGPLHVVARILIAPWYAAVVAGALGTIVLFVRGFFI